MLTVDRKYQAAFCRKLGQQICKETCHMLGAKPALLPIFHNRHVIYQNTPHILLIQCNKVHNYLNTYKSISKNSKTELLFIVLLMGMGNG
jgi:hypothetical protein